MILFFYSLSERRIASQIENEFKNNKIETEPDTTIHIGPTLIFGMRDFELWDTDVFITYIRTYVCGTSILFFFNKNKQKKEKN